MNERTWRLQKRFFGHETHPYRVLEGRVEAQLRPDATVLDAGCGRGAPVLLKFVDKARKLIGVDLVDFTCADPRLELHKTDLARTPIAASSVDLVYSRSVVEHLVDPRAVFAEMHRILKPGGCFIVLTANLWDYASIAARVIPNRFHPAIVARVEGRAEEDTFPIQYKANTRLAIRRHASAAGLDIERFEYLGQYPNYFMFSAPLFLLGTAYQKAIHAVPLFNWLQGWILVTLRKPICAGA
jgi:SAM-dependent methyltransferase